MFKEYSDDCQMSVGIGMHKMDRQRKTLPVHVFLTGMMKVKQFQGVVLSPTMRVLPGA